MMRDGTMAAPEQVVPCRKGWCGQWSQCRSFPGQSVSAGCSRNMIERTRTAECRSLGSSAWKMIPQDGGGQNPPRPFSLHVFISSI